MVEFIQVTTTTENREDAEKVSREIVERRLAACVQVLGPIRSTYWWKERIEQTEEWLCVVKSRRDLYGELERAIKKSHPYEVPEIVATPIIAGSQAYLEWLEREVKGP